MTDLETCLKKVNNNNIRYSRIFITVTTNVLMYTFNVIFVIINITFLHLNSVC